MICNDVCLKRHQKMKISCWIYDNINVDGKKKTKQQKKLIEFALLTQ